MSLIKQITGGLILGERGRQWYDSVLLDEKEVYGIKLSFVLELVDSCVKLNKITLDDFYYGYKPAYPWSLDLIEYFDYFIDETNIDIVWEKSPKYKYMKKPKRY